MLSLLGFWGNKLGLPFPNNASNALCLGQSECGLFGCSLSGGRSAPVVPTPPYVRI